jgi:hypothetical protein
MGILMAGSDHESGKVIWLDVDHGRSIETRSIACDFAVFLVFLIATCLAAEMLSRAFTAWTGLGRNVALNFVSASGFL